MARFLVLFLSVFLTLSVTAGSVAHAMEPIVCIDNVSAQSMGHTSGDGDQVPADSDTSYPHHHGGCHAHQMADRVSVPQVASIIGRISERPVIEISALPASPVDPALRPPIA